MSFLGFLGSVLGGLGGVGGKNQGPYRSMGEQALGARAWAKETGFNPLTLLGLGSVGAPTGKSAPPLASLAAATGAYLTENFSDEAKTRKEHNKLQNELLKLEVDRARAVVKAPPVSALYIGGSTPALVGRGNAARYTPGDAALSEDMNGQAIPDARDNTVEFESHGQTSTVPVGPDMDEVITGALIEANNRNKAAKARMSMGPMNTGTPLAIPPGFVNRTWELMPPVNPLRNKKPKPRPVKNHLVPDDWFEQQFN